MCDVETRAIAQDKRGHGIGKSISAMFVCLPLGKGGKIGKKKKIAQKLNLRSAQSHRKQHVI